MVDVNAFDHFSFDLWMTIIKSNPQFKPSRSTLLKDFFEIDKDVEVIHDTIRYYDNLFSEISQITGRHFQKDEAFLMILDKLGKEVTTTTKIELKDFFIEADKLFLENLPELLWINIIDILEIIKKEGKTANILSNTAFIHGDLLRAALEKMGLSDYFSFMIFSDEVGFSKPNQQIFNILYDNVKKIGTVDKNRIVHIGDNIKADFNGALEFGINAEFVKF